jgi:hypothetical protein
VYYTSYIDVGNASVLKILKKLSMLVVGGLSTTVFLKWGTDYTTNYQIAELSAIPSTSQSEYNVAQYNINEYFSTNTAINRLTAQLSNTGQVFQVGIEANIVSDPLSIQQIDIFFKTGRTV